MLSSENKSEKNRVFERTKKMRPQNVDLGELLPHDKMAEQAVLGAIIIQNSILLQILDILTTDDFFSPANNQFSCDLRLIKPPELSHHQSLLAWYNTVHPKVHS